MTTRLSTTKGTAPRIICHAVSVNRSTGVVERKRLIRMVPVAQQSAAIRPRNLLNRLECISHGSMINNRPISVLAAASHCLPRTRSPSSGQAISRVQIGMVKISTAVLPGPPSTKAQV